MPADTSRHRHSQQQAAMKIERITTSDSEIGGHARKDSACTTTSSGSTKKPTPAEAAFISPISPTEQRGHCRKRTADQAMFEDAVDGERRS